MAERLKLDEYLGILAVIALAMVLQAVCFYWAAKWLLARFDPPLQPEPVTQEYEYQPPTEYDMLEALERACAGRAAGYGETRWSYSKYERCYKQLAGITIVEST